MPEALGKDHFALGKKHSAKLDGGRPLTAGLPSAVDGRHTAKTPNLPCGVWEAHGKVSIFAVCQCKNTRRIRDTLPCANAKTLGEVTCFHFFVCFLAYMSPPIQTSNISEYIHHRQLIYHTNGTFNINRVHVTRIEFMSHKSNIKRSPNKV